MTRKFESLAKSSRHAIFVAIDSGRPLTALAAEYLTTVESIHSALDRRAATRAACETTRDARVAQMAASMTYRPSHTDGRENAAGLAEDFGHYAEAERIRTGR